MLPSGFLLSFLLLSYLSPSVYSAFTYNYDLPGSCDDLEVSWTGSFVLIQINFQLTPRNRWPGPLRTHFGSCMGFHRPHCKTRSFRPFPQVFGTPRTFKIPNSAVKNGKGSYSAPVKFPANQKIFLVMSDATGFGSGGTSLITQVGPSLSGKTCNTTDPGVDFFFNLDSALTQCR
jgi:hypothetical protein